LSSTQYLKHIKTINKFDMSVVSYAQECFLLTEWGIKEWIICYQNKIWITVKACPWGRGETPCFKQTKTNNGGYVIQTM